MLLGHFKSLVKTGRLLYKEEFLCYCMVNVTQGDFVEEKAMKKQAFSPVGGFCFAFRDPGYGPESETETVESRGSERVSRLCHDDTRHNPYPGSGFGFSDDPSEKRGSGIFTVLMVVVMVGLGTFVAISH